MEEFFKEKFNNRTILVTGHTGFKGAWLVLCLLKFGANVVGYSLPVATKRSLFDNCRLAEKITHIEGDLRDNEKLRSVIETHTPSMVFHFAAQSIVSESCNDPFETFDTNIMGTASLLEACKDQDFIEAIINITSDKCYENRNTETPYLESDALGGIDPYSASKACSELITNSYRRTCFNNQKIATVRAGNVIGGGDWIDSRIIPYIVNCLIEKKEIGLRTPHVSKSWQHVLDPLYGYLKLAVLLSSDPKGYAESWNFGPETDVIYTVEDVVQKAITIWGEGSYSVETPSLKSTDIPMRLDITKAEKRLDWIPNLSLDQSINMTIEWYKYWQNNPNEDLTKRSFQNIDLFNESTKKVRS